MLDLRRDSWSELSSWEPTRAAGDDPLSPEWFDAYVERSLLSSNAIYTLRRNQDDCLLGHLGLGVITRGPLQSAYAGYWIGTPHQARGYMTEGLELLLEVAFLDLGLHRVEANIRPENQRSLRLAQRVGFEKEGYSPSYLHIDGAWRDHERLAILAEPWRANRD